MQAVLQSSMAWRFYSALSAQTITKLYLAGAGLYLNESPDPNTAGNLLLNYPLGTLQGATTVTGPYTDVPGASTPLCRCR